MWWSRSKAAAVVLAAVVGIQWARATSNQAISIEIPDINPAEVVVVDVTEPVETPQWIVDDLILSSNETSPYPQSKTATHSIRLQPGFRYAALDVAALGGNRPYLLRIDEAKPFARVVQSRLPLDDTSSSEGTGIGTIHGYYMHSQLGAAVYSIPLEVAPGINGFSPQMSIVYNSQAGNGYLGEGWNLQGVSSIVREGKSISYDGVSMPLNWQDQETFSLDGIRLKRVSSAGDSIVYALWEDRPEDCRRVVGYGINSNYGPSCFKVYYKNGEVWEYGAPNAPYAYVRKYDGKYYQWMLRTKTDRFGNTQTYKYVYGCMTEGLFNHRLSQISYGGNKNAGTPDFCHIQFEYEVRPDTVYQIIDGYRHFICRRLSGIKVRMDDGTYRSYELDYKMVVGRSSLSSIRMKGTDGIAYPATTIQWIGQDVPTPSWNMSEHRWNNDSKDVVGLYGVDYDGNGVSDLIEHKTYSTNYPILLNSEFIGTWGYDFHLLNGFNSVIQSGYADQSRLLVYERLLADGLPVIKGNVGQITPCYFDHLDKPRILFAGKNRSGEFCLADLWSNDTLVVLTLQGEQSPILRVADFNRDGYDDVLLVEKSGQVSLIYGGTVSPRLKMFSLNHNNVWDVLPVDLNNDGFYDLAALCNGVLYIYRNEVYKDPLRGYRNRLVETYSEPLLTNGVIVKNLDYGDFNGDGVIDLMLSGSFVYIYLSNGEFGFHEPYMVPSACTAINRPVVIDFDNDGRSDLLCVNERFHRVAWLKSSGRTFTPCLEFENNHCPQPGQYAVGDFNGDGLTDLICTGGSLFRDEETNQYLYYQSRYVYAMGKVKSVTDGLGVVCKFDYRPLTDPSLHEMLSYGEGVHGLTEEARPLCLLAAFSMASPSAGRLRNESYHYTGGIRDNQGCGFLGFMKLETTDLLKGRKITENSMLNPSTGGPCLYPLSETISLESGELVSKKTMRYSPIQLATGAWCRWLSKTIEDDYLTGTSVKRTTIIDSYGNPTQINTVYADNSYEKESRSYDRVYAWCPDRMVSLRRTTKGVGTESIIHKTHWVYDVNSKRMSTVFYQGTAQELACEQTWNVNGLVLSKSLTDGVDTLTTTNFYDDKGRLVREQDYCGMSRQFQYDTWSQCVSEISDYGERSFGYDGFGRLKSETDIYGNSRNYYKMSSNVAEIAYYDVCKGGGRPTQIRGIDYLGREVLSGEGGYGNRLICRSRVFDKKGLLQYVSSPYYEGDGDVRIAHSYHYDAFGRLISERNYLNDISTDYAYSGLETTITTQSSVRRELRNARGWMVENEWNGKKVNFGYDSDGHLLSAQPDDSPAIQFAYDVQGNRTSMKDPDAGEVRWSYDAFGRVKREARRMHLDMDSVCSLFAYRNGRLQEKQIGDRVERFTYENGLLVSDVEEGTFALYNQYDSHGNLTSETLVLGDSLSYTTTYEHDGFGRLAFTQFPSGVGLIREYDEAGFLTTSRMSSGDGSWHYESSDTYNRLTGERLGLLSKSMVYNRDGSVEREFCRGVMDNRYSYGTEGLLMCKTDDVTDQSISYGYDEWERLRQNDSYTTDDHDAVLLQYDAKNNLSSRSDWGGLSMEYESEKPHALTGIDGIPVSMDREDVDITYTDLGKVSSVVQAEKNYRLYYGPEHQRIRSQYTVAGRTETHDYFGNYEEVHESDGNIRKIHYLCHDSGLWGMYVKNTQKNDSMYYALTDYQHNLTALTDSSGNVVRRYAYDVWGGRRMADNWSVPDTLGGWITSRGFSMHEHLDGFNLINMNGRVYDPLTSQFLSPDLVVQAPDNWLNYNRYAYCLNNPVKYWDPSGYNYVTYNPYEALGYQLDAMGVRINYNYSVPTLQYDPQMEYGTLDFCSNATNIARNASFADNVQSTPISISYMGSKFAQSTTPGTCSDISPQEALADAANKRYYTSLRGRIFGDTEFSAGLDISVGLYNYQWCGITLNVESVTELSLNLSYSPKTSSFTYSSYMDGDNGRRIRTSEVSISSPVHTIAGVSSKSVYNGEGEILSKSSYITFDGYSKERGIDGSRKFGFSAGVACAFGINFHCEMIRP